MFALLPYQGLSAELFWQHEAHIINGGPADEIDVRIATLLKVRKKLFIFIFPFFKIIMMFRSRNYLR